MLGIVNVPLYPSLTSDSIEYILNDSESKAIVVSTGFQLNKVQKVMKNCKHLKQIIILNDHDDVSVTDNLFTFAQIQEKGKSIQHSNPDLIKKSATEIKEDDIEDEMTEDTEEEIIVEKEKKSKEDDSSHDAEEIEKTVFETIKEIEGDVGAQWDSITEKCEKKGINRDNVEEALTSLMDKGLIYEPVLGTIKTT